MKTKTSYLVVAVIMMVALSAGVAFAQRSCFCNITNLPGLGLTSDQKAKLEKNKTEHCKKMIRLRADLSIAKLEKNNMITNKNFKKDAVQKQIEKIMAVKKDVQMARLDALTDIRGVLTDEQWATFSATIGNECGRPCFKKGPDCGRQMRGKHHRGAYKGKGSNCGMGPGPNREGCPFSGNPMRTGNEETAGHEFR